MNPDYSQSTYEDSILSLNSFMSKVFGWLFLGLLTTGLTGYAFLLSLRQSATVFNLVANGPFVMSICILELVLVFTLSASVHKISPWLAKLMFFLYAILNGVTISLVCLAYAGIGAPVGKAFLMAAVFFGTMCVYGFFTKADLTSIGKVLTIGLIAIIISSVINFFTASSGLDFIICIAGLAIFIGLTAYDTQKIKNQFYGKASGGDSETASKYAIIGALELYLDFINMFLFILRLLGRRR